MKKIKNLIIGGGITGLCLANNLADDYLIIEKENEVGGLCRTFYKDDYIWDFAGHFFHFATKDMKKFFENRINNSDMVSCQKNTKIQFKNRIIDYPFQKNIHQLEKNDFIQCLLDLYYKEDKVNYTSFEEMLYCKFGESITEKFLKPYNEKLYACNLNMLDSDAMGRFFPYANFEEIMENIKESKNRSYNDYFEYPKKGAVVFVNALLKDIDKNKILLNSEVTKIDLDKKLVFYNNDCIQYENLINTISLKKFINLIDNKALPPLSSNKVLVFNIGFDQPAINKNIHWMYFPDKDINFYRVGFYNNILDSEKLSIYVEIGYPENSEIDIDNEYKLTLQNLMKVGIINTHKVIAYQNLLIDSAYVHISKQSKEFVKEYKVYLKNRNVYSIGRYGSWTYCSIEDCLLEAKELANTLNKDNSEEI